MSGMPVNAPKPESVTNRQTDRRMDWWTRAFLYSSQLVSGQYVVSNENLKNDKKVSFCDCMTLTFNPWPWKVDQFRALYHFVYKIWEQSIQCFLNTIYTEVVPYIKPYHNILLDAGDLTDETIYNLSKYVIILGQIFLKSPLRYDELRQTNEHESVVRKYPKYRIPIIDRVHVPAKVHRFTKFKQAHLNIEGPRVVKKRAPTTSLPRFL